MNEISRDHTTRGLPLLSVGFRPFFLVAALWAAFVIPIWLASLTGRVVVFTTMTPLLWHVHELVFGFGAAVVTGFLLTAVPNWTGRSPLHARPLAILVLLWFLGRVAIMFSAWIGTRSAAVLDLAHPIHDDWVFTEAG